MPIRVVCPTCKSNFPIDDAERGKQIRCRQCGALMAVPPAASPPDAVSTGPPPLPTVAPSRAADDQRGIDPRRRPDRAKSGARALVPLLVIGGVLLLVVTCGTGFMGLMLWLRAAPAADVPLAQGEPPPPAPVVEPPPEIVAPVMEGTIPVAVLQQIKDATVFVRMDAGAASGTGSGFLMRVDGDSAYFATNDHVVTPKSTIVSIGRLRPRLVAPPPARISVVLYSGTQREQTLAVEVVTADADADLAILRAVGARNLPAPIDFTKQVALVETMPVFVCGYPFGQALTTNKSNPAITVGKGSISSLRNDEHGELDIVQIDGDLNPGNSGGPLVDARGRLVGVAVAKIKGTRIGLAIPTGDLTQLLAGRVQSGLVFKKQLAGNGADVLGMQWMLNRTHGATITRPFGMRVNNVALAGDGGDYEVEAKLLDPLRRVASVSLLYTRTDQLPQARRNAQGRWDPLPGGEQIPLKIEGQKAVGGFNLPAGVQPHDQFAFQLALVNGQGQTIYTQPRAFRLNFNPGMVAAGPQPPFGQNKPPANGGPVQGGATRIMGGAGARGQLRDQAPAGGMLIGFNVGLGKFFNNDIIAAVQPIYRTSQGEVVGKASGTRMGRLVTVKAKDGYAVAGITAKAGLTVDGFSVRFMRVAGDALDPTDAYTSEWIGGRGGGGETYIGGGDRRVVGIVTTMNDNEDCTGLGLLLPP